MGRWERSFSLSFSVCVCVCACMRVCVCEREREREIQYYVFILFWAFYVHIFVALAKRSVLPLVCEIQCCTNDPYYYHQVLSLSHEPCGCPLLLTIAG